jgi:hypothetical protein
MGSYILWYIKMLAYEFLYLMVHLHALLWVLTYYCILKYCHKGYFILWYINMLTYGLLYLMVY